MGQTGQMGRSGKTRRFLSPAWDRSIGQMGHNNFLERIGDRFAKPKVIAQDPPSSPCRCGSLEWWLPRSLGDWRCGSCTPSPSDALVAQRHSLAAKQTTIINQVRVTCCTPWCHACGGWQAIDREWSDGGADTICASCKEVIASWPDVAESGIDSQREHAKKATPESAPTDPGV